MRLSLPFAVVLFASCANDPPVKNSPLPDWSGPPLQVTSRGDRGLEIELTAPTAGHTFEVRTVHKGDSAADVHVLHRTPGDAFVAQVLTPLRVVVDRNQLGDARRITVWIATLHGAGDATPKDERLAFELTRP